MEDHHSRNQSCELNTMPAMPNPFIYNAGRLAAADSDTIANLPDGAQLGLGPNLPNLDGVTPLVFNPIVPIVIHSPSMFNGIPYANDVLKALCERHAKEIQGIDFELQLEGTGTPIGHDGQEAHMPTIARRSQVSPQFTWTELNGNLVWNFMVNWIKMIKHPDTQASVLSAMSPTTQFAPQLFSWFSMDMMFIQYDNTMRPENIIDAYFVANMWPQASSLLNAKHVVNHAETVDRTIQFYGIVQHNRNTKVAGQIIAQALQLHVPNFDYAPALSVAIEDAVQGMGIQEEAMVDAQTFTSLSNPSS